MVQFYNTLTASYSVILIPLLTEFEWIHITIVILLFESYLQCN